MLKEYIQNLQIENDRKINNLEQEMQELVNDLNCAEHMLEELQKQKKLDSNIFSPRAMNQKIDDHITEKQEEIRELKHRMEYVTQMMEEGLKNQKEYQKLEDELVEESMETSNQESMELSVSSVDVDELLSFLDSLYHKTETSLAFLNGNKNRCRSELKDCQKLIKDYVQKLKNI